MTVTISQLEAFDRGSYDSVADYWGASARQATTSATELRAIAARVRTDYTGPAGEAIAKRLEEDAERSDSLSGHFTQGQTTMDTVADEVDDRRRDVVETKSAMALEPLSADDDGTVSVTTKPTDLGDWLRLTILAIQFTYDLRTALYRAAGQLAGADANLAWLCGEELHTHATGPIDMDYESIRLGAAADGQGKYGDCVSLSTLTGIANADPSFVQKHMVWDPEQGVYHVTLYGKDGKPIVVDVDPDNVPSGGAEAYGDAGKTWLTIYEEALRRGHEQNPEQIPDLMDGALHPDAVKTITGQDVDRNQASFADMQKHLDGPPPGVIVVGTSGQTEPLPEPGQGNPANTPVNGHAYYVKGFDEQGRIILGNPWGPAGGFDADTGQYYPGELHLTEEEFRKWFNTSTRVTP